MMKPKKISTFSRHISTYAYVAATLFLLVGYLLMSGDGSDFSHFCPDIFSPLRIRVAPVLCLIGYLLIPCGIMLRPRDAGQDALP